MAPRANWKGFLRLSLVTCPVALYPATSDSEKVSFNQINRKTGHRIKYAKVDADTGEEVASEDIMKGYKVDTDTYIEVSKDELDEIALESTRTIEIDEFVPKSDIDGRYLIRPYYLVPDGKVGHDAFAVIRETIRSMNKVAIGRLVLTNREHIIALEPLDKGLMGTLLRYPYEVRSESEYFDDIQDVKITKDMLDLAKHIVEQKSGSFEPEKFEDRYESALVDLINKKRNGATIATTAKPRPGTNVVDLMTALRQSLGDAKPAAAAKGKKAPKRAEGQREMLLPISGKKAAKENVKEAAQESRAREKARRQSRADKPAAGRSRKASLMRTSHWTPSVVADNADQTVYLVIDDFDRHGRVIRETDVGRADLESVIADLVSGQYNDPVRIVAFNTARAAGPTMSPKDVARELRRRADLANEDLSSAVEAFVERHSRREVQLTLRLV